MKDFLMGFLIFLGILAAIMVIAFIPIYLQSNTEIKNYEEVTDIVAKYSELEKDVLSYLEDGKIVRIEMLNLKQKIRNIEKNKNKKENISKVIHIIHERQQNTLQTIERQN